VAGIIKLALLLWNTWFSQGKLASKIFQHGIISSLGRYFIFILYPYMCTVYTQGSRWCVQEVRGNGQDPESEIVQACRSVSITALIF
jgi:hypothetical protein